jgi:hypothetical protein
LAIGAVLSFILMLSVQDSNHGSHLPSSSSEVRDQSRAEG